MTANYKYLSLILVAMLYSGNVQAKYNPPKDIPQISLAQRAAMGEFNQLDSDGDGFLTREEFGAKSKHYSRYNEKNIRKAKKKGFYKSKDEQFDAADTNKDDKLTIHELALYIAEFQKNDKGRARYY